SWHRACCHTGYEHVPHQREVKDRAWRPVPLLTWSMSCDRQTVAKPWLTVTSIRLRSSGGAGANASPTDDDQKAAKSSERKTAPPLLTLLPGAKRREAWRRKADGNTRDPGHRYA